MNSELNPTTDPQPENQPLAVVTDPALTLAAKKLAGSANCLNCGTGLQGPFCYYCGQPDRNFLRFFPALLRDLMEDLLDLDSRFMRTLKPLLFKPGRLTRDYMDGRRFRYAPPMRLYIFSSIAFFLLAALLSSNAITIGNNETVGPVIQVGGSSELEQQEIDEALSKLPPDIREQIDIDKAISESDTEPEDEDLFDTDGFQFNDQPWDRETNPVDISWLPAWINDRINDEIEGSPQKAQQINDNPNLIVDKVFDVLPGTMFVLLPVVALIFKFWYLFAKRYYLEHLIFSLHNHAFIFICLLLILLTSEASDLLSAHGFSKAADYSTWLVTAIGIWIPVYLLVSLRTVFQQNWLLTTGKFVVIGFSYMALLLVVTTVVAIASFVML